MKTHGSSDALRLLPVVMISAVLFLAVLPVVALSITHYTVAGGQLGSNDVRDVNLSSSYAYLATDAGLDKVRLSDGVRLDYITHAGGFSSISVLDDKVYLSQKGVGIYRWDDADLDGSNGGADTTYELIYHSGSTPALLGNAVNDLATASVQGKNYLAVAGDEGGTLLNETDGVSVFFLINAQYSGNGPLSDVILTETGDLYTVRPTTTGDPTHYFVAGYYDAHLLPGSEGSYEQYVDVEYIGSDYIGGNPPQPFHKAILPIGWHTPVVDLYATTGTSTAHLDDNTIYMATQLGLIELQEWQGNEQNSTPASWKTGGGTYNVLPSNNVQAVTVAEDKLYGGLADQGVVRIDLDAPSTVANWWHTASDPALVDNNVRALNSNNRILAGTTGGASLISMGASPPVPKRWLVMVYLNGDNNLDFWTGILFNRLEMAACNSHLDIMTLWDRSNVGDTNLYHVQCDNNPYTLAPYTQGVDLWPQGELNMGDPQTLIDFVTHARAAFPDTYSFLAMVDHGNGWAPSLPPSGREFAHTGMSFDDTDGGAYLSTSALEVAFGFITGGGAEPVDIVFYDACLMSMIENVYPLRDYVRYFVGSENEGFASYPYELYLGEVTTATQPITLAQSIVIEYDDSLQGYPRTIAAFDLSQAEDVARAIDDLAQALRPGVETYQSQIGATFDSVQKFDSNLDLVLDDLDGYVDVRHFAQLVHQNIPSSTIQTEAMEVMTAIDSGFVVAERHHSGVFYGNGSYWNLDKASGLSLYLPLAQEEWLLDYYNNTQLSFVAHTGWDELIADLYDVFNPPEAVDPPPILPEQRPGPLPVLFKVYLPLVTRR